MIELDEIELDLTKGKLFYVSLEHFAHIPFA